MLEAGGSWQDWNTWRVSGGLQRQRAARALQARSDHIVLARARVRQRARKAREDQLDLGLHSLEEGQTKVLSSLPFMRVLRAREGLRACARAHRPSAHMRACAPLRAHLLAHLKPSLNSGCAVSVARSGTLSEAMLSICTAGLPVLADIPGTRVPRQRQGESPRSVPLPRAGRGTDEGGQRGDGHAGAQAKEG